jgi:hypothetical protein
MARQRITERADRLVQRLFGRPVEPPPERPDRQKLRTTLRRRRAAVKALRRRI